MTRCPNCGSAIRIGAKFCTSCGFRLTVDEPVSSPAVAPARSPFATTSSPAWSAEPAVADAQAVDVAEPVGMDAAPEVDEREEDEPAWREIGADQDDLDTLDLGSVDGAGTDGAATDNIATINNNLPGPSWMAPPPQDTSGPVSDDMLSALDDHADELTSDVAEDTDDATPTIPAEAIPVAVARTTYAWDADDQQIKAVRNEPRGEPDATGTGDSITDEVAGSPLAEARELAARLSAVLATIQTGNIPARSRAAVVSGIADESDVNALRNVIASAQDRPRDVDVMLDLVLRADTIAEVLADRDRLLAALKGDAAPTDHTAAGDAEQAPADDAQPSTYPAWSSLP